MLINTKANQELADPLEKVRYRRSEIVSRM